MTVAEQARRLLDKQGQELTEGIVQELEAVHNELASLRRALEGLRGGAGAEEQFPGDAGPAVISAGEHVGTEQGFYPAEQTEAGTWFNWSGPTPQFSFAVRMDRARGADVRLEGINFLDFDRQKDVKLFVDGLEVPVTVTKEDPGIVIAATLQPQSGTGRTSLAFLLPETLPPENPEDKRMLGLAFVRLTVTPRE